MHPQTHKNPLLLQDARGFIGRALGQHVPHTGARGVVSESPELGVFMKEKGIGVRGISTKVWDWLIQTLTVRLLVSQRASGPCSCGLGAYLCSHSNQLMYDFTRRQEAIDRGEVPARWCQLRQDSLACVLAFFFIFTVKSPALASGLIDNSFT